MSITVLDAMKLNSLKNFNLVAGQCGLNRYIEKVGILDYEFVKELKNQFIQGEFVLSSLLFAKDDVNLLIGAVKSLIEDNVACLAIKNIYYNELLDEIIEYANEKNFPIFIFDNSVFFEDIITEITDTIRAVDNYQLIEGKIDIILQKNTSKTVIRELAMEINNNFNEHFITFYFKEKKYRSQRNIIGILENYKLKNASISESVFKYKDGILAIVTKKDIKKYDINKLVYDLVSKLNINTDDFYIGIGNYHSSLYELDYGITECLNAVKIGEKNHQNLAFYNDIGIYKILLPYLDDHWMQDFCLNLITPIKNYDEKNSTDMLNTAIAYIDNEGKIKNTAQFLFQHENTIRYRINKIKEILKMENSDGYFYEQLSIAIKIYKLTNI